MGDKSVSRSSKLRPLNVEDVLAGYSEGRRRAIVAMMSVLENTPVHERRAHSVADDMIERAINSGAMMLTENHVRKMRTLALELGREFTLEEINYLLAAVQNHWKVVGSDVAGQATLDSARAKLEAMRG